MNNHHKIISPAGLHKLNFLVSLPSISSSGLHCYVVLCKMCPMKSTTLHAFFLKPNEYLVAWEISKFELVFLLDLLLYITNFLNDQLND